MTFRNNGLSTETSRIANPFWLDATNGNELTHSALNSIPNTKFGDYSLLSQSIVDSTNDMKELQQKLKTDFHDLCQKVLEQARVNLAVHQKQLQTQFSSLKEVKQWKHDYDVLMADNIALKQKVQSLEVTVSKLNRDLSKAESNILTEKLSKKKKKIEDMQAIVKQQQASLSEVTFV